MTEWKYWTPERDGHAPDDWSEGMECEYRELNWYSYMPCRPTWRARCHYRYRPLQDATYEPDLLAQCLALPQDQREALIEAMQKPQRDWADDVWDVASESAGQAASWNYDKAGAAVIRSMCRPKEVEIGAADLFIKIIETADYEQNMCRRPFDKNDLKAIELIREALS